jgi:excisionase family DNA binding protein
MEKEMLVTKTWADLRKLIEETINSADLKRDQDPPQHLAESEKLLTRIQTAKYLHISLVTLDKWTKEGILPGYRMGGRKWYKESEILESLESIRAQKYAR